MTTCKNCDQEFKGKFCPNCGQKAKTGRITLREVVKEARQHFIHFDQGFLYTIRELFLRPGHSVRAYLAGRRVKHVRPLKFVFWTLAVSFLVFHYTGMDQVMIKEMTASQSPSLPKNQLLSQKLMMLLTNHPTIMVFTLIPFITLFSWLLFRRRGYNYAEHFVLSSYLMGELSLLSLITTPMLRLFQDLKSAAILMAAPSLLIWLVYFALAYTQFFQSRRAGIWIKGILVIMLGYLTMIIFVAIATGVAISFFQPQLEAWLLE